MKKIMTASTEKYKKTMTAEKMSPGLRRCHTAQTPGWRLGHAFAAAPAPWAGQPAPWAAVPRPWAGGVGQGCGCQHLGVPHAS